MRQIAQGRVRDRAGSDDREVLLFEAVAEFGAVDARPVEHVPNELDASLDAAAEYPLTFAGVLLRHLADGSVHVGEEVLRPDQRGVASLRRGEVRLLNEQEE